MALQFSQQVADQQTALNNANKTTQGYTPLKVDGLLGPLTQAAITKYPSSTPTGLNNISQPNSLTPEQVSKGYSTISGMYDPVTGKLKTDTKQTTEQNNMGGIDTSKLTALGVTPEQIAKLSSPEGLDPNSFNTLLGNVKQKLTYNNELMDQRVLIMKHLFDSPLTPEQQAKLPQDVQNVLAQGKDAAELQLRVINDQLQGRAQSLSSSIKDLTSGYTATITAAEKAKADAEENVLKYLELYGANAVPFLKAKYPEASADIDKLAGMQTLAEKKAASSLGSGSGGIYDKLDYRTANAVIAQGNQFGTSDIVKKYNNIVAASNLIRAVDPNTQNPAEHQAVIYNFAKALDPDSVVREGEYATVKKYSQNLINKYGGEIEQAIAGTGFLSPAAIRAIQEATDNRIKAYEPQYNNLKQQTKDRINKIAGQDVADIVLLDYEQGYSGNDLSSQVKSKGYDYAAMKADGYSDEEIKSTLGI